MGACGRLWGGRGGGALDARGVDGAAPGAEPEDGVSALQSRWQSVGRALDAYARAADRAGRADLLRPVLRLLCRMPSRLVDPEAARALRTSNRASRTIAERDALVDAVRSVPEVSLAVVRARDALADARYGEERYEESQLFLQAWEQEFVAGRSAVAALCRALTRSVG